ncbi:MAG: division/cell wall cluster transcriptional repressor MraZ [Alphaproteobacteria bacterium]|nr:division/cell wall cluster transcriptional repressor MraZ [Alphaproteobacteria bacterium]
MALFLSTFEKQIDKKGRVSVPPTFRAVLSHQNFNGIIVYPSFVHECLEACGMDRMEKLYAQIESLDPFSEERDAFTTAILGSAVQLAFDNEGRVVLPESLLKRAGITEHATFIGKGATFEIWAPAAFAKHETAARDTAKAKRATLKSGGAQ